MKSNVYVNIGKIIFIDVTQAELDEMIPTWHPSDFNGYRAYVLGRGNDGSIYQNDAFGSVLVCDGNGGTVQIGDENGYSVFVSKGRLTRCYVFGGE